MQSCSTARLVFLLNGHKRAIARVPGAGVCAGTLGRADGRGAIAEPVIEMFGNASRLFGPVPQMLLGIAMVMVLFENERNAVQENALALLHAGRRSAAAAVRRRPGPQHASRAGPLANALPMRCAAICITERWRGVLPSVQRGFSAEFLGSSGEHGRGRIHLRTGLPAQRILHLRRHAGDDRALARHRRRHVRRIQADPGRAERPASDRRQPADPRTQFRRDPVSARRAPGVSVRRTCGC